MNSIGDPNRVQHVYVRLLCRYEREVNLGQRPVLRKVLEGDMPSGRCMVLRISAIRNLPNLQLGTPPFP